MTPEGYKPFITQRSIIRIKDADPVTLTRRWTENGPILPGSHYNLGSGHAVRPCGVALLDSAQPAGHDNERRDRSALCPEPWTRHWRQARNTSPPRQNLTLVDQTTIAMKTIGAMPRRSADSESRGRMPCARVDSRKIVGWGSAPIRPTRNSSHLPAASWAIPTTKPWTGRFPLHVSFVWGDTQRVHRWKKLMESREVHTRDSFIEAQLDTVSFHRTLALAA